MAALRGQPQLYGAALLVHTRHASVAELCPAGCCQLGVVIVGLVKLHSRLNMQQLMTCRHSRKAAVSL